MIGKARLERLQSAMKARLTAERAEPARRLSTILANNSQVPIRRPRAEAELAAWLQTQETRKREAYEFRDMARKIDRQAHEMKRERYVTAILGVRTSWPRIVDAAKYVMCAESL